MSEPTSVRLETCPKCKERFYDLRNGICYACGYKGWGFYRPEEGQKRKSTILQIIVPFAIFAILMLILVILLLTGE